MAYRLNLRQNGALASIEFGLQAVSKTSNKPNVFKLCFSAMAAAFGVQSRKNLEEDFKQSSIVPFILAGVIFTALFVGALVLIVKVVLASA